MPAAAFDRLAIIGCGLMGGSFALAARRARPGVRITGYSPTAASVEAALARGAIDAAAPSAAEAARGADLVLVSVPVASTRSVLAAIAPALDAHALVMDVGSTKADVVAAAAAGLGERARLFVPAHPMAGKESSGIAHADPALYDGRLVILTPSASTDPRRLARARGIWQALGAEVREMAPAAHDEAIAAVSHLPHLLAFAYLQLLIDGPEGEAKMALGGPGFRDFTRIAAGDPTMWRDILLANRDEVLRLSRGFRMALERLEALVAAGDGAALHETIAKVSAARAAWPAAR